MSIYTKQGDRGQSDLQSGRTTKTDARFEVLGDLDELSAAIGMANGEEAERWIDIQTQLLDLGSAVSGYSLFARDTLELEQWIDELTQALPPLKNFVLALGESSRWHWARAVCRRAERHYWAAALEGTGGQYLNRLSDLLFQQARSAADGDVRYKQSRGVF